MEVVGKRLQPGRERSALEVTINDEPWCARTYHHAADSRCINLDGHGCAEYTRSNTNLLDHWNGRNLR